MPRAKLNDINLFYHEVGVGEPCLVMHGGLGLDHTCMCPWLDTLGDILHLVYYDHRCNGRSDRAPIATLTIPQLCDDAEALREFLGFGKVVVMGHSFGGFVALEYALRYPDKLSQLILVGTAPAFKHGGEVLANAQWRYGSGEVVAALTASPPTNDAEMERVFRAMLPLYFHTFDEDLADRLVARTVWSAEACVQGQELMDEYDVSQLLGEINAPTLIIVGEDDLICPVSQAIIMSDGIPHSELVVIQQAGHFPYVEQPDMFFSVVSKMIKEI